MLCDDEWRYLLFPLLYSVAHHAGFAHPSRGREFPGADYAAFMGDRYPNERLSIPACVSIYGHCADSIEIKENERAASGRAVAPCFVDGIDLHFDRICEAAFCDRRFVWGLGDCGFWPDRLSNGLEKACQENNFSVYAVNGGNEESAGRSEGRKEAKRKGCGKCGSCGQTGKLAAISDSRGWASCRYPVPRTASLLEGFEPGLCPRTEIQRHRVSLFLSKTFHSDTLLFNAAWI